MSSKTKDIDRVDKESKNVLGGDLKPCGYDPVTGYLRNGFCERDPLDHGRHTVCAIVTDEFLNFTKQKGNDLSSPNPLFGFPGLKAGDHWCLCALRWKEAHAAGCAPPLVLEATEISTLEVVDEETLLRFGQN